MSYMEESVIVERLFNRDQSVLEDVSGKYKNLYNNIIRKILDDDRDVIECENDVLLAVWNSIPPNRPNNLSVYICSIARNISVNRFKHNTRAKRNCGYTVILDELNECIPDTSPLNDCESLLENKKLNNLLCEFLRGLDAQSRILFVRRYFYLESVSSLAERYEMSENKVSVKIFRIRKKLRKFLEKEGHTL